MLRQSLFLLQSCVTATIAASVETSLNLTSKATFVDNVDSYNSSVENVEPFPPSGGAIPLKAILGINSLSV